MKAHLGNTSCHTARERKQVTFPTKNKKPITGRKSCRQWHKVKVKRKKVRLISKKKYVDQIFSHLEEGIDLNSSLRRVSSVIKREDGFLIKK